MNKFKGSNSPPQDYRSPLLTKALQKYRSELRGGDDIVLEAESLEQLLNQAKFLDTPSSRSKTHSTAFNRLEPVFSCLNDFIAVIIDSFGADANVAGLIWGSIRIILTLAASSKDILKDIIDMLEEISIWLPKYTIYDKTQKPDNSFESGLIETYTELTCFCARTINLLRDNPHYPLFRKAWPKFSDDFQNTMKRLERRTQMVEAEARAASMRIYNERQAEVLSLMKAFQEPPKIKRDLLPCYFIPLGLNERLIGREDELRQLREALDPQECNRKSRSFALCGMGGVGKTAIALQYAKKARDLYDAIFWITADNMIKMTQNFLDIARNLDLVPKDRKSEDANAAMAMVKQWLNETGCRWLVVFDNADDLEILTHAWPGSAAGSILLTSRDYTAAYSPASAGLIVQPFDDATGAAAFLELVGQTNPSQANIGLAREITHKLGGLPLALRQISGFFVEKKMSLKDFLSLYNRNAGAINAGGTRLSDYQHTLSTVWRMAFRQLTGDASFLQKLLTFFDPDRVDELILTNDKGTKARSDEFDFLYHEWDFLEAKEVLLRAALIGRSEESSYLSVHRLVQSAVMESLTIEERKIYIDQAIKLLVSAFPCPWKSGPGYTFTSWDKCQMCLPHVHFLVAQAERYKIRGYNRDNFAELLLRCCWYLYESERCHEGLPLARVAMETLEDHNSLIYAQGIDIQGLLWLDTFRPKKALACFDVCWKILDSILEANDPFIAVALNHISLAYTELRDFKQAAAYQQKAINIRLDIKSTMIGNSYSNMSSILLGMDKPDEAEAMLMKCPSLNDMTDESFLRADNPRFSSDMVLLGRIRVCQKRFEDALRLRSKALVFLQKTYGDRYKTCDSLYQIADLLYSRGDLASAANLLDKSLVFLENLPEPDGFIARAYFKLAEIHASLGSDLERQKKCKDAALDYRKRAYTDLSSGEEYEEANFNSLVPWMLW